MQIRTRDEQLDGGIRPFPPTLEMPDTEEPSFFSVEDFTSQVSMDGEVTGLERHKTTPKTGRAWSPFGFR